MSQAEARSRKRSERFKPSLAQRLAQSVRDRRKHRAAPVNTQPTILEPTTWETWHTTTNTHSVTITTNAVWNLWTDTGTTANGASTATWRTWTTGTSLIVDPLPPDHYRITQYPPPETEEQRRYRLEQEARQREHNEAQIRAVSAARHRAMELLHSMLTPEQSRSLHGDYYFLVRAPSGRTYRINEGVAGNVWVVDPMRPERILERLCIHQYGVPPGDVMLMQKLLIETAEAAFRTHANITLPDGRLLSQTAGLLDGDRLANVLPLRRAS